MKKVLSIVLTLALLVGLVGCLGGCDSEPKPLRICVDGISDTECEKLLAAIEAQGGPTDIEFDILTVDDANERSMQLTRLRTEIMSGQGPDAYIMTWLGADGLFRFPEKNMELGMFYPLDNFIENAQFMQFDEMLPQIMELGKSEEYGQVLLPMSYWFPFSVYLESNDLPQLSADLTWYDLLNSSNSVFQVDTAAHQTYRDDYAFSGMPYLDLTFGQLGDYQAKKLSFTEEELLGRIYEILEQEEKHRNGEFDDAPEHYDVYTLNSSLYDLNANYFIENISDFVGKSEALQHEDLAFIPIYSDDGGITAQATSFCAIDATTKRAKDAFFVLDVLMSKEYLRLSEFCAQADPYKDYQTVLNDANFAKYTELQNQISNVHFSSALNTEMIELFDKAANIYYGYEDGSEDDIAKLVTDAYRTMRQSMSE